MPFSMVFAELVPLWPGLGGCSFGGPTRIWRGLPPIAEGRCGLTGVLGVLSEVGPFGLVVSGLSMGWDGSASESLVWTARIDWT